MIHCPKSTNAKCIYWLLCFCAFLSLLLLLCGWATDCKSMVTPAGRHSRILKTTTNHCSFPGGCKNAIAVAARQSTSHHIAISKNKHSPFDDPFCLHSFTSSFNGFLFCISDWLAYTKCRKFESYIYVWFQVKWEYQATQRQSPNPAIPFTRT